MASKVMRASNAGKKSGRARGECDEGAINREIASLLLNLHASKAEDLSSKQPEKAMDLSAKSGNIMDLSQSNGAPKLNLFNGNNNGSNEAALAAAFNYNFYPMANPLALNSNYLLQNLLLANKMQQQMHAFTNNVGNAMNANAMANINANTLGSAMGNMSANTLSSAMANMNANTLGNLNANAMANMSANNLANMSANNLANINASTMANMSASTMANMSASTMANMSASTMANMSASTMADMKTSNTMSNSSSSASLSSVSFPTQPIPAQSLSTSSASSAPLPASVLRAVSTLNADSSASTTTIPLLCGQIVAQLNALLFLVHNLSNDSQLELSLQSQLSNIFIKLQEIVSAIELAKSNDKSCVDADVDEEKIAKQLQEYQRALMQQIEVKPELKLNLETPLPPTTPMKTNENPTKSADTSAKIVVGKKRRASDQLNNDNTTNNATINNNVNSGTTTNNVNGTGKRRRGRPAKEPISPDSSMNDEPDSKNNKDGSKGIRNRVFCGDCSGCLKNDDCGLCRYCKDKTKFGGQNRLRQKCLHRRCHMDTHRRRVSSSNGGKKNTGSNSVSQFKQNGEQQEEQNISSPGQIYSGLDLARLAAAASTEDQIDPDADAQSHPDDKSNGEMESNTVACSSTNRTGSRQSSTEDEVEEGQQSVVVSKSRSRIDKWKAKHEAMLKMAEDAHDTATLTIDENESEEKENSVDNNDNNNDNKLATQTQNDVVLTV